MRRSCPRARPLDAALDRVPLCLRPGICHQGPGQPGLGTLRPAAVVQQACPTGVPLAPGSGGPGLAGEATLCFPSSASGQVSVLRPLGSAERAQPHPQVSLALTLAALPLPGTACPAAPGAWSPRPRPARGCLWVADTVRGLPVDADPGRGPGGPLGDSTAVTAGPLGQRPGHGGQGPVTWADRAPPSPGLQHGETEMPGRAQYRTSPAGRFQVPGPALQSTCGEVCVWGGRSGRHMPPCSPALQGFSGQGRCRSLDGGSGFVVASWPSTCSMTEHRLPDLVWPASVPDLPPCRGFRSWA